MTIDIKRRVLIEYQADPSQLEHALEAIQVDTNQTAQAFQGLAGSAGKALDTIGLGAENQVGRLQRFHDGFQQMTGGIGRGLSAIDEFGKALGPWNQALELGGKAIKFLGDGLDAYGRTSASAKAEVEKLTKEFTGLKDAVMATFGEMTVGALKAIPSIRQLELELEGVEGAVMRTIKAFNSPEAQKARAMGFVFGGGFIDAARSALPQADPWAQKPDVEAWLSKMRADYEAQIKAAPRSSSGQVAAGKFSDVAERAGIDTVGPPLGFGSTAYSLGAKADTTQYDSFGFEQKIDTGKILADIEAIGGAVEKVNGPTLLERLGLNEPESWSLAVAGVQAFGQAWQQSLQAIGEGNMSAAEIFKKGLAAVVRGVGDQLAALGAAELVKGSAMAITLNPMAPLHLAAGGVYSAGAVAAYAAAAKLGGGSGGSAQSIPTGGHGSSAPIGSGKGGVSDGGSGSGSSPPTTIIHQTIVYGDSFAESSPRQRQLFAEDMVARANGGSGGRDD